MIKRCKCKKPILYDVSCQGCAGHKGPHWSFDGVGWLVQWKNKTDKDLRWKNIALSYTPPSHKNWIHPKDYYKKSYRMERIQEEIEKENAERKKRDEKENVKVGKTRKRRSK
jgi:hypothetical protein